MMDKRIHFNRGNIDVRFFHKYVQPFERMPKLHCHAEYEIAFFMEGQGLYTVGSHQYSIRPGDAFLFGSYEPHIITRIDAGHAMHTINLHFTRSLLCSTSDNTIDDDYFRFFVDRNQEFSNRIEAGKPIARRLGDEMLALEQLFDLEPGESLLRLKPRVALLLDDLRIAHGLGIGTKTPGMAARLRPAYEYIEQNLNQPFSLEELAQTVNMSPSYFSTIFHRLSGITPWEFIQAQRIRSAISLIREGELSMLDIALNSGFNNTANFNRAFRKITGTTPKSYRP